MTELPDVKANTLCLVHRMNTDKADVRLIPVSTTGFGATPKALDGEGLHGGSAADGMRIDLRRDVALALMSRGPDHIILEIQLGLQGHATLVVLLAAYAQTNN